MNFNSITFNDIEVSGALKAFTAMCEAIEALAEVMIQKLREEE